MSANVESMFYVRTTSWHGLGTRVEEALTSEDALLGEGVRYETAGSLDDGRKVWLLARLPERYQLVGEDVDPYIVFTNTHDAPDLSILPKNAWRVINAVSDHATHAQPLRMTKNYRENLFDKVITGHPLTDKAMKLLAAV